ncbi:MAG: glycoside hydrolase family 28 protein [Bacteroidales bacterium]|nr:glycoside hydrolase family 28 protein [Bacteroidales bacterium]MBR0300956.1 glycoside hydrolase family 28 protein [Bacteroidales bacterium]
MKYLSELSLLICAMCLLSCNKGPSAASILAHIKAPVFRDADVRMQACDDFRTALNDAIVLCSEEGGGRVVVPAGEYTCNGPIILRSNVNLHLEKGATIFFGTKINDYLPAVRTLFEGTELYNYSPFVYAYEAENIALTGEGVLDGQASQSFALFRPQRSAQQDSLRQMGFDGIPVENRCFGERSILPPSMIQPFGCKNVLIEGVTLKDSPYWVIHPVLCDNVTVRGISISSYNLNNDGCDPEHTSNVLIENCRFDCGDDAIAIKAGRDQDAWRRGVPTKNILIRNCDFNSKCNGLCIGSEMSAGVENVVAEHIRIGKCHSGIYFKSNLDRGGYIKHVRVRDVVCDTVRTAFIRFDNAYHQARGGHYPTLFDDFIVEDVYGGVSGECGFYAVGLEDKPLGRILLKNIELGSAPIPYVLRLAPDVRFKNIRINGMLMDEHPSDTEISQLKTF